MSFILLLLFLGASLGADLHHFPFHLHLHLHLLKARDATLNTWASGVSFQSTVVGHGRRFGTEWEAVELGSNRLLRPPKKLRTIDIFVKFLGLVLGRDQMKKWWVKVVWSVLESDVKSDEEVVGIGE